MGAWLVAHELFIVGTLLAIIGTGYMGYAFLNLKFLRRLSRGFTYGLVGGIIGGVPIMIVLFLFLLLFIILLLIEDIFIPGILASGHVGESAKAALSLSTTGFLFGLGIGFLTGIVSLQKDELAFLKIFSRRNIFLLFLLGALFALLFTVYEVYSNQGDSVILLIASLYGFVLGTLFGSVKFSWIKWASGLISSFVAVVVALWSGYLSQSFNSIIVNSLILISILIFSLFFGYMFFNQPQFHDPNIDKGSWWKLALWLVVGWTCGFVLLLLSNLLLKDVTSLIIPASAAGILIAFGNGEGKKLLNEPKPRYELRIERSNHSRFVCIEKLPHFSWERFRRGFSIAFIFAIWASSLLYFNYVYFDASVYNLLASLFKQIPDIYPSIDFYVKVSALAISLIFGLCGGFITAIIYAYSYVLLAKVEGLLDRRIGQIGFVLFTLGTLIAALPYLLS